MNNVVLMGRLTRDPDVRYSTQGDSQMAVARFTLAVDRRFKRDGNDQSADFISCVAFGKTGEFIEKYVTKGTKLTLSGRIQTGSYTNKDGQKVFTTDVVAENVEFYESKAAAGANGGFSDYSSAPAAGSVAEGPQGNDGFLDIPDSVEDDGLPF